MNKILQMHEEIQLLDGGTQIAILGSWGFLINAACINQAMKFIPDIEEEEYSNLDGIEGYTAYEAARRELFKQAGGTQLPALINLQRLIFQWLDTAGASNDFIGSSTAEYLMGTHKFLTRQKPTKRDIADEWIARKRAMPKFSIPKAVFVEYEYQLRAEQHQRLVAKGEDAIRLCDTVTIGGLSDEISERYSEMFDEKLKEKLHSRWEKLEYQSSNPRLKREKRDQIYADQELIRSLLVERYAEIPGWGDPDDAAPEYDITSKPATGLFGITSSELE